MPVCEVEPGTFRMRKHDKRESVILVACVWLQA